MSALDARDHAFRRAMQLLLPYFYCGLFGRISVDEPCLWDQRHGSSSSLVSMSSFCNPQQQQHHHHHHHYHYHQQRRQRQFAAATASDILEEDRYFYDAELLATATPHCTHYVTVLDSINDALIGQRIRVPGLMLIRFMDRVAAPSAVVSPTSSASASALASRETESLTATSAPPPPPSSSSSASIASWNRTRRHIETHCRRLTGDKTIAFSSMLDALMSAGAEQLWRNAQADFLPMPTTVLPASLTTSTSNMDDNININNTGAPCASPMWIMVEASLVGRYSQCVLSNVKDALKGPIRMQERSIYVIDEVARQRVMMMIRFDLERVYAHGVATTLAIIDHDPTQRDALVALLGVGNYRTDFDMAKDVRMAIADGGGSSSSSAPLLSETDLYRTQHDIGLRLATACSVCSDNVAQIAVLPCRHLVLCIACAIKTYALNGDYLLPNGMPRLMATARCVSCNQPARSCCRIMGLASS